MAYFKNMDLKKDKIIQLISYKDKLLGLTESGLIIEQEEYSEIKGKEVKPSIIDKQKNLITIKTRWKEY